MNSLGKLTLILSSTLIGIAAMECHATEGPKEWPIITRQDDMLYEGDTPFRFFGLAAPNIHQNESQVHPDFSNRFPDDYEIRDVLASLQFIGSRATRSFSLSISSPENEGLPTYVTGPGEYNEEAFQTLDRVLALCHEYDVRVIIPFIASQSFKGWKGVDEFAALHGKERGAFWTDEAVKEQFRRYLNYIVNRRNTVSGILYKDDPAILAWQFGNEFDSYAPDRGLRSSDWEGPITEWSKQMAAYLKQIDPKHLIMEAGGNKEALIADPNIDVISIHLYEYWNRLGGQPTELGPIAKKAVQSTKGRKPLMIDEFGLATLENNAELMRTIRDEGIVGGLLWSIRGHRRDGGWYYHNEGGTPINSYHIPGFAAGHSYGEQEVLDLLRREAFAISGKPVPALSAPHPAPILIPLKDGFTWRGSALASHYSVMRSSSENGPWTVVATGLHDSVIADVAPYEAKGESTPIILWSDQSAQAGQTWFYKIRAHNAAGDSGDSPVVKVDAE